MLKSEAAAYLAGVTQTEGAEASAPTNLHVITGEVGEMSEDGKALIKIDGLVFSESNDQYIEIDALGGLEEGDIATLILSGEQGHAMTPLAIGSIGSIDRITVRIAAIEADYIKVEQLDAAKARIGELEADHVSVDDLDAATARIGTLETTRATITDLEAATARIHELEVDHVSIDDFEAEQANIDQLQANTADIDTIRANSAKVQNLTAAQLEADHATVGSLSTNYAHITNGVIDNATIGYADVNNLSAHYAEIQNGKIDSALINTAAIVDEQVFTVTGNKATLAQIDASKINVLNLKAKDIEVERINGQPVTNKTLVDALSQHESDISDLDSKIDDEVEALNDRIDGAIETFTGTVAPTLSNEPASSWNTTKLKDQHVGDVYYVVNSQSAQNGYCYRFTKSGSTYSWQLIKDSDVTAALSRLQTAEGKIGDIEQFDETVGSFMTDTDDELSSLKAKDTQLETSLGDKVSTSTFNTVSQKVDANEANITSMSTVLTNNGLTSSTNITNTVNTVRQTADTNKASITSLTQTVNNKADSTTVTTLTNRVSTAEQNLNGITTRVGSLESTTTSHGTRLTNAETAIEQNAEDITLRATKAEVQSLGGNLLTDTDNPVLGSNIAPKYSVVSGGNGTGTIATVTDSPLPSYEKAFRITGNTSGNRDFAQSVGVVYGQKYLFTAYARGIGGEATALIRVYSGSALFTYTTVVGTDWTPIRTIVTLSGAGTAVYKYFQFGLTGAGSIEYIAPCLSGGTAANTAAELKVANDNIDLKVSKDGVISSINQSAETVKIQASRVEIDGTAIFTAISSDVDDAITDKGYATTTQAQGYASTAKSEAISAAATDATNKANAAQTAATNVANTATDNKLKSYSTTAQANELYDAKGAAADVQTNLNSARSWYAECSTAAATVAKVATITPATTDFKLTNGVVVNVKFSATNTGAVGSLTLNVNGTGAKSIKTQRSNSLTNLGNAGVLYQNAVIPFVYNGQYWLAIENYNSDTYNRVRWQNVVTILEKPTGTWRILCGTASGYKQVAAGVSFDLAYPILSFSNQPEANATADTGYLSTNGLTFSNTAAIQSGAAGKTIFLKGAVAGNTFTIDSTNVFTTVVPTSEDGFFYIPLGIMTSATAGYFESSKDLYAYLDGRFRQVTPTEIVASQRIYYRSKVSGTVPKPTAWVTLATNKYNDTVSVGNGGWSTKVTPIAASKAENVTKYLYLYTCEQRKRLDGTVECTAVTLDENTTIIDGGNIITGTVTANKLNAADINASKSLTVGAMTDAAASTILNSNLTDDIYQTSRPNLTPYFSMSMTQQSDDYWVYLAYQRFTKLNDGWAHFEYENTGSSTVNNQLAVKAISALAAGSQCTLLLEFRNASINIDGGSLYSQQDNRVQVWGAASTGGFSVTNAAIKALPNGEGIIRKTMTLLDAESKDPSGTVRGTLPKTVFMYVNQQVLAGQSVSYDLRLSVYDGIYDGPYKPYSGDVLFATNTALAGTNESLEGAIEDIGELSDQLVGTVTEQNRTITDIQTYLNSIRKDLDAEIQSRQQWFNFNSAEGLVIGAAESSFKTVTTNTSQQFRSGGTVLAETSGTEFVAPVMRSDQLLIGSWMWTRRDNGNLSLKWIG